MTAQTVERDILSKKVADPTPRPATRHPSSRPNPRADGASLYAINGSRKYLNADERWRALAAVDGLPSAHALFCMMLAWSGARPSEALALTATSFQIERGIVAIRTLKRRRHVVREVPLPPSLIVALDTHFGLAAAQHDAEAAQRRLWPWCRQTAWRIVKRMMARADIVGLAASPRGLRHGFGIATLEAGVPINLTQRWLGHSRLSTTAIYADACGAEEIAFAARLWRSDRHEAAVRFPELNSHDDENTNLREVHQADL